MTRRELLKHFCQLGILATPFSSKLVRAVEEEESDTSHPKFVLIYDSTDAASRSYGMLLENAGPYLAARDSDWYRKVAVWDMQRDEKQIKGFADKYGRNTESFQWPILIAVSEESDETEVETWTIDWVRYTESRFTDVCYPVSGGWWSVEGDWNPSIQKVRNHLYQSPNHSGGRFEVAWLDLLKFEELQSLHSDHHREMTKKGKVYWRNVNSECGTQTAEASAS